MEIERGRTGRGSSHLSNGKAPRGRPWWAWCVGSVRGEVVTCFVRGQRNANGFAVPLPASDDSTDTSLRTDCQRSTFVGLEMVRFSKMELYFSNLSYLKKKFNVPIASVYFRLPFFSSSHANPSSSRKTQLPRMTRLIWKEIMPCLSVTTCSRSRCSVYHDCCHAAFHHSTSPTVMTRPQHRAPLSGHLHYAHLRWGVGVAMCI